MLRMQYEVWMERKYLSNTGNSLRDEFEDNVTIVQCF
jgi:hypothetical protein